MGKENVPFGHATCYFLLIVYLAVNAPTWCLLMIYSVSTWPISEKGFLLVLFDPLIIKYLFTVSTWPLTERKKIRVTIYLEGDYDTIHDIACFKEIEFTSLVKLDFS